MLEFCFDYSCPYAYLASTQIRTLAEEAGVQLVYKPFLLGGVFKSLGAAAPDAKPMPAPRAMLNALDMRRWAEHWQVPLNMPATHPNRTVTALRATLAAEVKPEAVHALYDAYWKHGRNLSDPEVVADTLNGVGLNGGELVERASDPAIKAELRERTDEAIARGVFGAPAMFLDGELYWGQDRMAMLARALGVPEARASRFGAGDPAARAEGRPFEFWYDFSSPFAYLASTQVQALAERTGALLKWRPFLLGGLFRSIGSPNVPLHSFAEAKQRYFRTDMQRHAEAYGVPLRWPSRFPMRTILPLRMAIAAGPRIAELSHAIFHAYWAEDRDISNPAELARIATDAGLDAGLVDAASDPEVKQRLIEAGEQALSRGLCGAPSCVVDGRVFWGQDRLGFVEKALGGWRPEAG